MSKKLISVLILLMTASLISLLGCSQPVEKPGNSTSPAAANRWLEMLTLIPEINKPLADNVDFVGAVYIQDHAYLAEKQAKYPEVSAVPEPTQMMQNNQFWNLAHYDEAEWRQTMGFTRAEMDREIFYPLGGSPIRQYQAILGRFNQDQIEAALKADPMNTDLMTVEYAGVDYYSAGEDGINLNRRSNMRPLGQGLRLALVDDFIFSASFNGTMQEMIDAYRNNIQSPADFETYQLLSSGLTELDAFTALLSTDSQAQSHYKALFADIIENPGEEQGSRPRQIMAEQIQREVQLNPYDAYATGAGLDEKGYYMAIVLLNPDKDTADYNAQVLEDQIKQSKASTDTLWSDMIDSLEVTSHDRLTLAKLYGRAAYSWKAFDLASVSESLLMYKG